MNFSAKTDELLLVTIPAKNAVDQKSKVKTLISESNFYNGFRPLGVYGGHLLAIKTRQLIAIDLKSGQRRIVKREIANAVLAGTRLFMLSAIIRDGKRALTYMDLTEPS